MSMTEALMGAHATNSRDFMERIAKLVTAARLETAGLCTLRYGLVLILVWIGGMKFTGFEAEAIKPLIETSPLMRWLYNLFDLQTVSNLLGITEIMVGVMIAFRPWSAKLALAGSAFAALMFLTTLSFLFSLPGWEASLGGFPALSSAGGFLVKDICLLGIALWSLGESAIAIQATGSKILPHAFATRHKIGR